MNTNQLRRKRTAKATRRKEVIAGRRRRYGTPYIPEVRMTRAQKVLTLKRA